MSDSEDDSFASADEGDVSEKENTTKGQHVSRHQHKVIEKDSEKRTSEEHTVDDKSNELIDSEPATEVKQSRTFELQDVGTLVDQDKCIAGMLPSDVDKTDAADTAVVTNQRTEDVRSTSQDPTVSLKTAQDDSVDNGSFLKKFSGTATEKVSSWQNWGRSWGSSLLSTAADSVSTLTSSVGEGLHTVVETMESGLGAPPPEEMLSDSVNEALGQQDGNPSVVQSQPVTQPDVTCQQSNDTSEDRTGSSHWLGSLWGQTGLANVTEVVQQTSKTLMSGGLDVLETIGKQTYNVLAEGDGGLKQVITRSRTGPDLSQTLREAKELAELRVAEDDQFKEARKANFGAQFDDFQGIVQLEALEILSSECDTRLQGLLAVIPQSDDVIIRSELLAIKDTFQLDSDDEDDQEDIDAVEHFEAVLSGHFAKLGLSITATKLVEVHQSITKWLDDYEVTQNNGTSVGQGKEIHQKAIQVMAELTAACVATYHRTAQLVLFDKSTPYTLYRTKATTLCSITSVLSTEIGALSRRFVSCLNLLDNGEDSLLVSPLITDVYLEASNSQSYVQNAFSLLLPILQRVTTEQFASTIK